MTTFKEHSTHAPAGKLTLAEVLEIFAAGQIPLKFTAYDGSTAGPEDAELGLDLLTPRGTTYLATAPGELGLARAYVSGDLSPLGVHPADPYELLMALADKLEFKLPPPRVLANIVRTIGIEHLKPIAPPPQEALPRWRRVMEGLRHSKTRDAEAIHHHYDVSNKFYEWVLGPSMTYTCACYPDADATLEEAQENKYRLVFEKLRLSPGDRLLDVGCGWGGMVRYAARHGVKAIGVTLSKEQAEWAGNAIAEQGLSDLAEVRHGDYRDIRESGFDAVSSIGLTEHIGVQNYPAYFRFLQSKMRVGALLLNHCITRHDNRTGRERRRFHRPLRLPRRGAHGIRSHHHRGTGRRPRGGARGEPAPPLRADAARLVPQPNRALGRGCRRGRAAHREGVGAVHGRLAGGLRDEYHSAAPGSGRQARRARQRRRSAAAPVVDALGAVTPPLDATGAELVLK